MSFRQQVARGVFWSATRIWGTHVSSLLIFLILSRLLEPKAFGLAAVASVFIAFVQIFLDQGFSHAIVQRAELDHAHLDTAFWTNLLIGALLTIGGIAAAPLVAALFNEPQLAPIIAWLSLSFLLGALSSTQKAILQRDLAFKVLAARSLAATAAGGAVGVLMALGGFGVWSLVAQDLTSSVVAVFVLWRISTWRPGFNVSRKHFMDLLTFGINIVGSKFIDFFNRRSDDFLIGYFLGPVALGYYTIAYRLLLVMVSLLTQVINTVAFPTFARLQNDPERIRRAFYAATQMTSLIAFPAFLGMSVMAPELVLVLFGPTWAPSAPVMQVLAFIGILHSVQYFNGSVIMAAGRPAWRLAIMLINAIANVAVFVLVVRWGIVAIAVAYVIVGYLLSPLSFLAVRSLIHINLGTYLRQFTAPLLGSIVIASAILGLKYLLREDLALPVRFVLFVLVGLLTYPLVIQLTAPSLSRQALELLRLALPSRKLMKA